MSYSFENISSIIGGKLISLHQNNVITHLMFDSRKTFSPASTVFFALKGPRRDGHDFIHELYNSGVRNFIVSKEETGAAIPGANVILVDDTFDALHALAAYHRKQFNIPVIGITGSNGKTIVKEWLSQLLIGHYNIVRSPKSYNSQLGVALSVWQINADHNLGIFEAGISQPGEMEKLEKMIQPTIGILTNIGEAHEENFSGKDEKISEKLKLFRHAKNIIAPIDDGLVKKLIKKITGKLFTWGRDEDADLQILSIDKTTDQTIILLRKKKQQLEFSIPFTDDASIENAISCYAALLVLGIEPGVIAGKMQGLHPVNMRLELIKGINHCSIINDSYSADLSSFGIALNFLNQQASNTKTTVILSDFLQTGLREEILYKEIAKLLSIHKVDRVIGIGNQLSKYLRFDRAKEEKKIELHLYQSVDEFIQQFRSSHFKEETILVKGARIFAFERIVRLLEQKVHQTVLEINLNAIVHNLKEYQKFLLPDTKIMAMVKAFAYGSGGAEIAGILQFHKVDYLGVAYADEGVELRKAGINLPVMVMNPEVYSFDSIIEHQLEPVVYSFELLKQLDNFLKQSGQQQLPVHIEIETGMNRLGFDTSELKEVSEFLSHTKSFKLASVFSHLAASEDAGQDEFTYEQYDKFLLACDMLQLKLDYPFLKHIANSAAIIRHPKLQMDMVRLGIGMYGVDNAATNQLDLQSVATLKSTVAQIKKLKEGESVSYNRKGIVYRDSIIATIRIGYADGYSRKLGNGVGKMLVSGNQPGGQQKFAPVIGSVCMDMTMIDVTDIPGVKEGDEVIVFGAALPIQQVAEWCGTIPYEIMTTISQRVKRVYFEE